MKSFKLFSLFIILLVSEYSYSQLSGQLILNVSEIRNKNGVLRIGIYKDDSTFQEEKPFLVKSLSKDKLIDGKLTFSFSIDVGEFGIALLDDENENGEMDYSFFIPQEGFGFSNYFHSGLRMPTFENFKFMVTKNNSTKINLIIKYY
ncbi:MAG: DUF2141 domain-containing protein [Flavobacteriales bacterium]|jgi:uncharacterized protein (DUF2141 family)|nr:DUF2141 domain-containing protein [Flavobacteriales bacterium]|tara:strand:- start:316 stop:756 length:441 start_codon:yes stop_codon:yes gene_type:complete